MIDLLKLGRPAGYESMIQARLDLPNHSSGKDHPDQVSEYLAKEVKLGAMVSPFTSPFEWIWTNPVMVQPKKEEGKFRVILDLSFPNGNSVNGYIPRLSNDGGLKN